MKKSEKPQAPSNREYLDLDTDEEEFGRQETPEPEEELISEPEKPVFTDEQLLILVEYVKKFTTLPGLEESDWSQEVIELVKEYFRSPANTVLAIFFKSRILKAVLDFPVCTDGGLTYFLRSPWQVYTPENFLSTIIFGSVYGEVEHSTLKFMENIYAPIAFRSNEWPAVMRNEAFTNLHEFLLRLTDATYSPIGLTILYVPGEGLKDCTSRSEVDDPDDEEEGLIERLERVARCWIKQIRETLKVPSSFAESSPCKTIVDEIRHWHYRFENLSCVHRQLDNKNVLSIVRKLESVGSASVKQYNSLLEQVRGMLEEATSNITYLNLLEEFSKGFEIPGGLDDYATRLLLLVRFIARESPFYNTREKIETLCQASCTRVVAHCRDYIDLDIVLDGDANEARKMIVGCIECCDQFSRIFDRLVEMDKIQDSPTIGLTDKSKVFNNVTTFVHRCNDLIGIVDARIAFDKGDEEIIICGPRGFKLEQHYRSIEERFYATLTQIKDARDDILNITSAVWLDRIASFKRGIKDVENMVRNWIDDIFKSILNIEEGIEALHVIERFSRRSYLRETLNNKWIQIWKMFGDELESCSVLTNNRNLGLRHDRSLPPYSGKANVLRGNNVYLTRQYKMLIDASDWFGDSEAKTPVTRKYKKVLAALTDRENELFSEWQKELIDKQINPAILANQAIIKYHDSSKAETIRPNLEMHYLDHLREIPEWSLLNYDTKHIFPKDCRQWETLKYRYNNAETMCKLYNSIVKTISETERYLFLTLLDDLEDTLSPGFEKTSWFSDSFERLLADCLEIIKRVQESLREYENTNCKIDRIIETIGKTSLVDPDENLINLFQDSAANFETERNARAKSVGKNCQVIFKLLLNLKNLLNMDEEKTAEYWNYDVKKILEKLKNSITNCMRKSLVLVLRLIEGDKLAEQPSITEIDVDPSKMKEFSELIAGINASAIKETLSVDEFAEVFNTDDDPKILFNCVNEDSKLVDLRKDIDAFFP